MKKYKYVIGILILFIISFISINTRNNDVADKVRAREAVDKLISEKLDELENGEIADSGETALAENEYRISDLQAKITVPDTYDVYSTDNEYTDEMCAQQNLTRKELDEYLELQKTLGGVDMFIIPAGQPIATADFKIHIKVKEGKYAGMENLATVSDSEFKLFADTLIQGFGKSVEYTTHTNNAEKWIVFDWKVSEDETRYATVLKESMVYVIGISKTGPLNDAQRAELKNIVNSLKY